MTAPKKPTDRNPKKETTVDYGAAPALVITSDEMADILKPYVFQLGDEAFALKSPNSFSVDDYGSIVDLASEDVTKVLNLVAFDERTEKRLGRLGLGVLSRVITGWQSSINMTPGEPKPSES